MSMREFRSCPICRGTGATQIVCGTCWGRGSVQLSTEPCPVCGDTYGDLWEHLASGRKGCGLIVLMRADNNYSVKLDGDSVS